MASAPKLGVFLILIRLALLLVSACAVKKDFGHCERVVKNWEASSLSHEAIEDKHKLRDLLFFLHVPRTGGRTYFHCFLKKLYPSSQECPRSYDKLRFDPGKTKCRLLVTHDDYSMMYKLPTERTSVMTILRNPVDRVFSTYEFSIEVAARFLAHPNLTSATRMAGRLRAKTNGVSTLDIWPWKYLVPWMREDLFSRGYVLENAKFLDDWFQKMEREEDLLEDQRDARRRKHSYDIKSNDSYNMEEIAMPLHKYIDDPMAHDIVHNGATFQIAGLTNNSYLGESHEVRHCVQKHKILGKHVLRVAKRRLDDMLYVGLTEEHKESATLFSNVVGSQVIWQMKDMNHGPNVAVENQSEQGSTVSDSELENDDHQNSTFDEKVTELTSNNDVKAMKENMTVTELMKAYEDCISTLRDVQGKRRAASLKRISPANFTKQARRQVPEVVLQRIKSLNHLDLELYKYAQEIFAKQHESAVNKFGLDDRRERTIDYLSSDLLWKVLLLALTVAVLFTFTLYVNGRRRTSKVKI